MPLSQYTDIFHILNSLPPNWAPGVQTVTMEYVQQSLGHLPWISQDQSMKCFSDQWRRNNHSCHFKNSFSLCSAHCGLWKYHITLFSFEILQYKTSKEGSTVGITVSHASLLAQCRALTQACGYSEGKGTGGWQLLLSCIGL